MSDKFNIIERAPTQAKKLLDEHADRTGIAESIFLPDELRSAILLIHYAAAQSDADGRTWYVVASSETLYATPTPPVETKDLDAVYVFELPSHRDRPDSAREVLTLLRAAKRSESKDATPQNLRGRT